MKFIPQEQALPADTAVWPNTEDVQAQAPALATLPAIALQFPKWTDGRAYSQAVLLRQRLRYTGELIATGDVLVDMLPLLQRCGFSAARLRAGQNPDHARRALGFFEAGPGGQPLRYQPAVGDAASPQA